MGEEIKPAITTRTIIEGMNKVDPSPNALNLTNPDTGPKIDAAVKACDDPMLRAARSAYKSAKQDLRDFTNKFEEVEVSTKDKLPEAPAGKQYVKLWHNNYAGTNSYALMTQDEAKQFEAKSSARDKAYDGMMTRSKELMKEHGINTSPVEVLDRMERLPPPTPSPSSPPVPSIQPPPIEPTRLPSQVNAVARSSGAERMA